jgi:hypothetical protein
MSTHKIYATAYDLDAAFSPVDPIADFTWQYELDETLYDEDHDNEGFKNAALATEVAKRLIATLPELGIHSMKHEDNDGAGVFQYLAHSREGHLIQLHVTLPDFFAIGR